MKSNTRLREGAVLAAALALLLMLCAALDLGAALKRRADTVIAAPVHEYAQPLTKPLCDINTADADTLTKLPGIGSTLAERIIARRETDGPFRTPEDLLSVDGIGETTLAELLPEITCGQ